MTHFTENERRSSYPRPENEMYKGNVDSFIKTERRQDELDRLREVKEQKRVWRRTIGFCVGLNLFFAGLAIWGIFYG